MENARRHQTPIVNTNLINTRIAAAARHDIEESMENEKNRTFAIRIRCYVALIFVVNLALSAVGFAYIVWLPCDEGGFVWNVGDTCRPSTSNFFSEISTESSSFVERYDDRMHQSICLPCDRVSPAARGMWSDGGAMDGDRGRRSERLCCKRLNKMVCTDRGVQVIEAGLFDYNKLLNQYCLL